MKPSTAPSTATPQDPTRRWYANLQSVLEQQQDVIDQLFRLAQQQRSFIKERNTDELLHLLKRRQMLIDQFIASQQEFNALANADSRALDSLSSEERDSVRSRIDQISGQLNEVMQLDQQDQADLETARDGTQQELGGVKVARKAHDAYRNAAGPTNRFADQRG